MSMSKLRSPKVLAIAAAVVLLVFGVIWGVATWPDRSDTPNLPKELTVEALQARIDDPAKAAQTLRDAFQRDDLTDEQRRQLRRNMRQVREAALEKNMDEYFAAAPQDRTAVLDRHIDRLQETMKAMEKHREQMRSRREEERKRREARRETGTDGTPAQGRQADRPRDSNRRDWRGPRRGPPRTPQARKQRTESRNPDKRARRMAYFAAARERAQQRGIEMPRGRGRPPGDNTRRRR